MVSTSERQDEVGLAELLAVVFRGKWYILASTALSLLGASIYLSLAKPVYEATARVSIGQVAGAGSFEVPDVVAARLLARYGEDLATGVKRQAPYIKSAVVQKNLPSVVQLVAEGDSPQQAVAILRQAFSYVRESHDPVYVEGLKALDERLAHVDSQRAVLVEQIRDAEGLVEGLKQKDPVQASLTLIESGHLAVAVTALDAERPTIVQRRMAPLTSATTLLGEIEEPAKPARPKKAFVVGFALVAGAVAGLLLALLVSLGGVRKRSAQPG